MRKTIELLELEPSHYQAISKHLHILNGNRNPAQLGLSILAHDTSAALISEESGEVVFASAEERYSNLKHDSGFPIEAIIECLVHANRDDSYISEVVVNFEPKLFITEALANRLKYNLPDLELKKLLNQILVINQDKLLEDIKQNKIEETYLAMSKDIFNSYNFIGLELNELHKILKWFVSTFLKYSTLGHLILKIFDGITVTFIRHHDAHAGSAYYGMGEKDATVMVIDGHGESDALSIYNYQDGKCINVKRVHWPISLGAIYLAATRALGFDYGDEYKVMGMAAYGSSDLSFIFKELITAHEGSLLFIGNDYWEIKNVDFTGLLRISPTTELVDLLGQITDPSEFTDIHFDFAHSLQEFLESIVLQVLKSEESYKKSKNLSIAGGVALNGLMNEAIRLSGMYTKIFVYPAAGDDGTSVGAVNFNLISKHGLLPKYPLEEVYFGHRDESDLEGILSRYELNYTFSNNIQKDIATLLHQNEIVCRFTGRAEFGPRALGHRSILANPSLPENKDILNERIKHREKFRPFAPVIPLEYCSEYFELDSVSPFMLFIVRAKNECKLVAPAVVHVDGTARVQTVTKANNSDLYAILTEFLPLSGFPILINTSFNLNGETIVNNYQDAIESFMHMNVDFLAIDDYIVTKKKSLMQQEDNEFLSHRIKRYFEKDSSNLRLLDCRARGDWFY